MLHVDTYNICTHDDDDDDNDEADDDDDDNADISIFLCT